MEKDLILASMAQSPGQTLYEAPLLGIRTSYPTNPMLLNKPVNFTDEPEMVTADSPLIRPGWYRYYDKTFSAEPSKWKLIAGVVSLVNPKAKSGRRIKSFGLEEKLLHFSNYYFSTGAIYSDGKRNTDLIIKTAKSLSIKAYAAEWCREKGGDLESMVGLAKMFEAIKIINRSLIKIGAKPIDENESYWCSTEPVSKSFKKFFMWKFSPADVLNGFYRHTQFKLYKQLVRAVYSD